jgi:hypothetical protein
MYLFHSNAFCVPNVSTPDTPLKVHAYLWILHEVMLQAAAAAPDSEHTYFSEIIHAKHGDLACSESTPRFTKMVRNVVDRRAIIEAFISYELRNSLRHLTQKNGAHLLRTVLLPNAINEAMVVTLPRHLKRWFDRLLLDARAIQSATDADGALAFNDTLYLCYDESDKEAVVSPTETIAVRTMSSMILSSVCESESESDDSEGG